MSTTNLTIRLDDELKKEADELFDDLGMNMTTAITTFLKQAVREQKIPFAITRNVPSKETLEVIEGLKELKRGGTF